MPKKSASQAVIDERRRHVAGMRLRGMAQREIVNALERMGHLNPDTGKGWSLGTINSDLQELQESWRDEAAKTIREHVSTVLAEIREVRRSAWSSKDLPAVLKALEQERKLLGLDAPQRVEQTMDATDAYIRALRDYGRDGGA